MITEQDIENYFVKARSNLQVLTEDHHSKWRLGDAERWDVDQEKGIITWTFDDGVIVTAPCQIVGTYNIEAQTYLWAWENSSILDNLKDDAKGVLEFAKENEIDFLQQAQLECDEEAAWDLAALANLLADREGVYRGPAGPTVIFCTFGKVKISK